MTISFTNRVKVCAGISNFGAENYWNSVYSSFDLNMGLETTALLRSQDQTRGYKKHYRSLTRVKIKRVSDSNAKVKNLMEKQKKMMTKKERLTVPESLSNFRHTPYPHQKAENDKKKLLGIDYKFYCCFVKGHKTNGVK